ncbi:hypothetical protein P3T73_02715 [Kiritimatiellota bacterium B12222]|nr:hypothetical protein P3T73_02715 [Kiritimatiellota bacterium B12222]
MSALPPLSFFHLLRRLFLVLFVFFAFSDAGTIEKPLGCFSSMLTAGAVQNPNLHGALVRCTWAQLEPQPGVFDFSSIEKQLRLLPPNKKWSLAVYAGWTSIATEPHSDLPQKFSQAISSRRPQHPHSPPWLSSDKGVSTFTILFRGQAAEMPRYWDPLVQEHLKRLMTALAQQYNQDERLQLVYVPQMTSNGIEGHFNGVPHETLLAAADLGPDEQEDFEHLWTKASLTAIRSTAEAFNTKAIAFEVHELLGSVSIPQTIMTQILNDPHLKHQVGIGMWWISGKTNYQSELLELIQKFPGDIYGQVIGRSTQPQRFPNGDYAAVFEQAQALGLRYIEAWNYEFEHHSHDDLLAAFNLYCETEFTDPNTAPTP